MHCHAHRVAVLVLTELAEDRNLLIASDVRTSALFSGQQSIDI